MIKNIVKAYKQFDNLVMKGVNSGMRAYNWTTGGTKSELSTNLMTLGGICEIVGVDAASGIYVSAIVSSIYLFWLHSANKNYKKIDEDEQAAVSKGALDHDIEVFKKWNKGMAYGMWFPFSIKDFSFSRIQRNNPDYPLRNEGYLVQGIGDLLLASSLLVMTADSLPPRKDFIRRGIDKYKEARQKKMLEPALERGFRLD